MDRVELYNTKWVLGKISLGVWFIILLMMLFLPQENLSAQPKADSLWSLSTVLSDTNADDTLDYLGREVTVGGIASVGSKKINTRDLHAFLQHENYGISLFAKRFGKSFNAGDSLVVSGELQTYDGLHEINLTSYKVYPKAEKQLQPKFIEAINDNPDRYMSMLIEGEGSIVSKGAMDNGKYFGVTFGKQSNRIYRVYISNFHSLFSEFDFDVLSVGDRIRVKGILARYNPPNGDKVYQIHLRSPEDLEYVWIPRYYILLIVGVAFAVILITVGWIVSLRSKVGNKTEEIQKSLNEKKVLLKEIHHRVKNNLSIISGLIGLQLDNTDDKTAQNVLKDSQSRIQSMALVHDKLYQTESLSDIRLDSYLKELVEAISGTFQEYSKSVDLKFNLDAVKMDIEKVIPCGLLVNELVVNAYKHAFSINEKGILEVNLSLENNRVTLSVADNGPGLPKDFELGSGDSLGSLLIQTFAAQLEADTEINERGGGGTKFTFTFSIQSEE